MNTRSPRLRPGLTTVVALVVAVLAVSSSAPLIAFAAAPALAIGFWRNGLTVAGAAWATGVDVDVSGRALRADVLALLSAVAAAAYTALGEQARATLSSTTYTWICYGTCAAILLVVCLVGGVDLAGYDG